jgi:phosphocarrier protein
MIAMTNSMIRTVTVANPYGLHFRACAAIVETADGFNATATVSLGMRRAEANSVLDLLMLAAQQGTELILRATGPEADTLLEALAELF